MDQRSVVVTGASTGIGLAAVRILINNGMRVFGSVRKQADAERLSDELGPGFIPLRFDVTDETAVREGAERVAAMVGGGTLLGLVNNAGIAIGGPLLHQPLAEFRQVLEVNVVGSLTVTQAFLPLLGADKTRAGRPGRIVNVSSVAGRNATPFLGAYAASKHGLEGLSESLRRELMLYGIDVIIVAPGSVVTPIWDKAEADDGSRYAPTDYAPALRKFRDYAIEHGRRGLAPEVVGEVIWKALTARRPRTRYTPVPDKLRNWTVPRLLPKRWLDRLLAAYFDLRPGV